GPGPNRSDRLPELVTEEQEGEVRARAQAERVIPPRAGVDVQKLVLAIPLVAFELDLDEPVVVDVRKEAACDLLQLREIDGLDERAGTAEIHRALSPSADQHRGDTPAFLEEPAVAELVAAGAGNQLLHHHLFGRDAG